MLRQNLQDEKNAYDAEKRERQALRDEEVAKDCEKNDATVASWKALVSQKREEKDKDMIEGTRAMEADRNQNEQLKLSVAELQDQYRRRSEENDARIKEMDAELANYDREEQKHADAFARELANARAASERRLREAAQKKEAVMKTNRDVDKCLKTLVERDQRVRQQKQDLARDTERHQRDLDKVCEDISREKLDTEQLRDSTSRLRKEKSEVDKS
ncbi:unnamed protein product [Amoebophrya sp. A120]|nr:unnamed protein product [Amoebophrya sp. A120]|eukprot:GSA120T00012289001.1